MVFNVYVESYGCSANQSNAEIIKGILVYKGFNIVNSEKIADVVILNSCVVKGPTLKRMEERIKYFSSKKAKLIVAGCMPEVYSERIKNLAPNASIISVHHIKKIAKIVKEALEGERVFLIGRAREIKLNLPRVPRSKTIGIVQIAQGCVNDCSYCVVKKVKGPLFSYPSEAIVKDVKNMLTRGCKEIWLTSQDNACYGCDEGKHKLPELLQEILELKGKFLVRVGMMNPSNLLPIVNEVIECYKNEKMFKFLHLPVQSGSDRILKLMNRNYRVKDFISIVNKFKEAFPDLTLSTDIIVGFPNESKKDFIKTLNLIDEIKPDIVNISKFWPMSCTDASLMKKQVSEKEKKKRAIALMKFHNKIAVEKNKKFVNKEMRVLIDEKGFGNSLLGRSGNYKLVVVKSKENLLGKFVDVKITGFKYHYLIGKINKKQD
ncbi:MAG: tRNA (N(6)-L-threonylcarbamoyladenosine(37)-C(2))-methylthiotransferase [Candidatus Pacearchaeota archaeon]|nr:tRNA (N(6)-L-threonylcarbamoyladenosine(37)-C(2))-methylthiotransferase [Candidatus Pacearchaeota archaeon]